MQWRSNLSVSSTSIPVQPSTGDSWMEMACRECLRPVDVRQIRRDFYYEYTLAECFKQEPAGRLDY
jgi:hypothetical protein